ncbi:Inner membrane protein YqjA [Vibrio mediterranei]|uniref:DedA family protein n=1 Tax=Vibrio mediterranei TaxID=689 RepID=UPI00078563FC|nr:DedA family protein [Vibrio mediterranei]MCG9657507.1 DedA family protein [Vibrio mediterranei]MCG9661853.1 DedA family protein [Vibrio mediterranei]SBO09200.1 Inner membrane protein YqjA [Vibrio mediterranei]
MQEIISAIWLQDFDSLLELNSLHVLLLLLGVVLFLESSFVFLPLPGDGLVLFVGGMVGLGAIDFSSALVLLTCASFLGSLIAYLQGRWLHNTSFMRKAEQTLPDESLPKARRLLNRYGFLSLFVSRFVPFVRVLTPMLMGVAQLSAIRTLIVSFTSSITWVFSLLLAGKWIMRHPFVSQYQEFITKWFLMGSLILMVTAFIALFIRLSTRKPQPQTSE